jgi:hypothetical protein
MIIIIIILFLLILLNIILFLMNIFFNYGKSYSTLNYKFPIRIGRSIVHGRGVFATKNINCGDLIEEVPLITNIKQNDIKNSKTMMDYVLVHPNKEDEMVIMLGFGSLYNDNKKFQNAKWTFNKEKECVNVIATKNILKNNEIFVSYGKNYWLNKIQK